MKKKIFAILAMVLCVCFCFAGCNLFPENNEVIKNQEVATSSINSITREEFIKGYNNYYTTFYNQTNDKDKAIEKLIEYLLSKKVYLNDAKNLLNEGKISLTRTEENYLWHTTLNSIITNIESFEEKVRNSLKDENKDTTEDDETPKKESQFVYTSYTPKAIVVFDNETNQYKIVVVKQVLVKKTEDGKEKYEYVTENEANGYDDSSFKKYDISHVLNGINSEKLFEGKTELTKEEIEQKVITKEAIRRYIVQLKTNEEGKNLSTENSEVFQREIERIYNILYESMLINKLYEYKTKDIKVNEDEFLNLYLSKVKACYDRYYKDEKVFINELTKTIGNAKMWGSYGGSGNCIENVFYVPKDLSENFFFVTHIVVKITESQIQKINDLKEYCEANGKDDAYYKEELYKIVPNLSDDIISKVIELMFKLEKEEVTKEQYETELLSIIGSKLLMVNERDGEGNVTKDVKTIQEMVASLYRELDEIYVKYYGEKDTPITLNGHTYTPAENGLIKEEQAKGASANKLVLEQLQIDYQNARGDKFNEYVYKYSSDTGTIQIQQSYFGGSNENWYLYAIGDKNTDNGFVKSFIEAARELNSNGEIASVKTFLMENWQISDGKETLKEQSTGFSTMFYAGKVSNLFECFDNEKFTLEDLFAEESASGNAKYYSLLKMSQYRLGLTMNKTLFDLIFEDYYDSMYNEIISIYEDEILKDDEVKINYDIIKQITG